MERRVLGKGLSALIPEHRATVGERVVNLPVDKFLPSRYQPREDFDTEHQKELISSIREKGIIQPVLVRRRTGKTESRESYELIAGERRLRAAKAVGMKEVPAIIREASDLETVELSLIENLQREALNPVEEAGAYQRLIKEFGLTQEKVAQAVGKDRASVANALRLLKLPERIKELLITGKLSRGHARALLALSEAEGQLSMAEFVVRRGLSVRETEEAVRREEKELVKKAKRSGRRRDPHIAAVEEELQRLLGRKVRIFTVRGKGKIQIDFYSYEDLEKLLADFRLLTGGAAKS